MTIKQAIERAEKVAGEKLKTAEFIKNNPYGDKSKIHGCIECAEEHRQLAAWLRELQERRKADSCKGCVCEGCDCLLCVTCRRICKDKYKPERRTDENNNLHV